MYFKDLLKYRTVWLGVALIWVILYHWPINFGPLNVILESGYAGVDICFFASGAGCFYSLTKSPDVGSFMERRLKRLMPTYLVLIVVWLAYQYTLGNFGFQMAIGNLLALQNFSGRGNDFNWYIGAMILAYILAPYFKIVAEKASPLRKILFLIFLVICSIPFWYANTYIITITRLPLFFVGMLFADLCKKEKQISGKWTIAMITSFVLGIAALVVFNLRAKSMMWTCGLYWYPFILIIPPLCVAISCVSMVLEKTKVTKLFLSFLLLCGDYCFELYLVHVFLLLGIAQFIDAFNLSKFDSYIWIAGYIPLVLGCFLLRRVTKLLKNICSKLFRKIC